MNLSRSLSWLLLAALLLTGLNLRLTGIDAHSLHPDEPTIARWINATAEEGEIRDRLYPGGFFKLAMPARALLQAWHNHQAKRAYQAGTTDRPTLQWNDIHFARRLNVALGVLTGLGLFFLALQITGNRLAALAAAAAVLLNPIHVEHCHYAETDTAMVFMLTVTLLLWARAIFTGQALFVLAGAFSAGFAAGTKFPLILLLVPIFIIPFVSRDGDRGRRTNGRTGSLLGLSLLLFAGAFAWTNPAILEPAQFMSGLANQGRGLHDEMSLALGGAGQTLGGLALWRLRLLGKHASENGLLYMVLGAAGLIAIPCASRFRRAWPLLILTPLLLLALNLFVSPFIRKQEFMAYLPFLAILAALPLALPRPGARTGRLLLQGAAAAVMLVALMQSNLDARRVASLIGWKDPRLMACDWNALHAPADKAVAIEQAASAAAAGSFDQHIPLRHVADLREGITLLERFPAPYLVRNEFTKGRGLTDPFTGRLRPRHEPLWTNFQARAMRLKIWSPILFPRANASHAGHATALYALDVAPAAVDFRIQIEEPLFISEAGRETSQAGVLTRAESAPSVSEKDDLVGGGMAILLKEQIREVAFSGPDPVSAFHVTLISGRQEARVTLTAWGRTTRVRLAPQSESVISMVKPWWWLAPEPYVKVQARATTGSCLMKLGRSPARGLKPSASALNAREQFLQQTNGLIALNGIPETLYNDFARIRDLELKNRNIILISDKVRRRDSGALRALKEERLRLLRRPPEKTCLSVAPYLPPVRLPRGEFRLTLDVTPLPESTLEQANTPEADRMELTDARGRTLFEGHWSSLIKNRDNTIYLMLQIEQAESPEIFLVTPVPRNLAITGAELTWTLRDRLQQRLMAPPSDLSGN